MSRVHIETRSYLPNYVLDTASILMYSRPVSVRMITTFTSQS